MKRIFLALAAVATLGLCVGNASAQTPVYVSPQPMAPTYYPAPVAPYPVAPYVGGTIVTPAIGVTGVLAPPAVVVSPAIPPIRVGVGYPYLYGGRPYYYPHHYYRW